MHESVLEMASTSPFRFANIAGNEWVRWGAPDSSANKYPLALKDFPRRGRIGLQDHGRPVRFRNLRVKPL